MKSNLISLRISSAAQLKMTLQLQRIWWGYAKPGKSFTSPAAIIW